MSTTQAAESWRTFTGDAADFDVEVPFQEPSGELGEHGSIDRIEYRAKKQGEYIEAYHPFRPNCAPTLAVDSDGVAYLIRGRYAVTPEQGIVDGGELRPPDPLIPSEGDGGLWILGELSLLCVSPFTDEEPWEASWAEGEGPLLLVGSDGSILFEEWQPQEYEEERPENGA